MTTEQTPAIEDHLNPNAIDLSDPAVVVGLQRLRDEVAAARGDDRLCGYTPWAFNNRLDRGNENQATAAA